MDPKKIGILTFHKALNYGAALQAYALLNHLQANGYDAEIIDFNPGNHTANTAFFVKPTGIGSARKDILSFLNLNYLQRRSRCFSDFCNKHYKLSRERNIKTDGLGDVIQEYDAVICGSDQIWNPRLAEADLGFFLPEGTGFKRISYAASLGKGYLTEHKHPDQVRKAIRNFDALSVREKATKERLEKFCTLPERVRIVVDPTLLIGKNAFLSVAGEKRADRPFIFLYSVTARENTIQAAKSLSARTALPVYTMFSGSVKKQWVQNQKMIAPGDVGPGGFLAMLRDAEYVVTDSFHGTVLSMLFRKRFFIICDQTRTGDIIPDERIGYLCDTFGIGNKLIKADDIDSVMLDEEPDWERIEQIRQERAQESVRFLEQAINGNDEKEVIDPSTEYIICAPDECTGCLACVNKCAFDALELKTEDDGRIRPVINEEKCTKCNACRKVCPILNPPEFHSVKDCYAAQWKKAEDRISSASGGISAVLTNYVLKQNGVVFGAAIDSDLAVRHICAEDAGTADRIKTSKYARSDIGYSYRQAKDKLKENRLVLFTGTPCQIAGLRNYLGKEYDNLICAEIVCHGTPPMAYLKQHIQKKAPGADRYSFRGGTEDMLMQLVRDEKVLYRKQWWKDEYFFAFNSNITLCESCYSCPFAKQERTADLTMGDFWKLDRATLKTPMDSRISLVLVNTSTGERIWNAIKEDLVFEKREISEALPGNPNLYRPQEQSPVRCYFLDEYRKNGDFDKAFHTPRVEKAYLKAQIKRTAAWKAARKIKHIIKP